MAKTYIRRPVTYPATPAEVGRKKKCTGCNVQFPVETFYVRVPNKLTLDGRRLRVSKCPSCFGEYSKDPTRSNPAKARARVRARTRLTKIVPELYEKILREELEKEGVA